MVRRLFAGEGWIRTIGSAILNMLRKTGLSETDQCTTERSWTGSGVPRAFVKAQSRSAAEEPMVCGLFAGGGSLVRTRLGILRVYKKGAKPLKRGQTIDIHIILTFFPERKTKFLKKDQYPSKLSIMQLTSGDFRHKSARRVRTRYGTLNCTAARHYLQRASARSVRRQYLIACAPDH